MRKLAEYFILTPLSAVFLSAKRACFLTKIFARSDFFAENHTMPTTPPSDEDPLNPSVAGDVDGQNLTNSTADDDTENDGNGEVMLDGDDTGSVAVEVDFKDIEYVLEKLTDEALVTSKVISAERGYTIEQLQNNEEEAWAKVCERYLKIATYKYRDVVQYYLPGVDEDDAKSAVADIVPDLAKKIADFPSLTQLDKAFRIALVRDIRSLQKKFLTQKRGEGKTDVTSELQGLDQSDERGGGGEDPYKADDEAAASRLENKINPEYGRWSALTNTNPSAVANRRDQMALVTKAMEELEEDERQIVQLSIIGGLKQKEIAERLGVGTKSMGSRLIRAKAKLKKLVSEKMLNEKKELL